MKLIATIIAVAGTCASFAVTISYSDYALISGTTTPGALGGQITARTIGSTPTSNHAFGESNQTTTSPQYTEGKSGGLINAGGTQTWEFGRNQIKTNDLAIASGYTANGTPLIATEENDWVTTVRFPFIGQQPASPPYALRVTNSAVVIGLANRPVRMSTDGDDIYVLENTGSGFEVQKVTYSSGSGTFTLQWSRTVSDTSIPADVMVGSSGCYVISDLQPLLLTGPAEFFVLDISAGTILNSFSTSSHGEYFTRIALGRNGGSGEGISGANREVDVAAVLGTSHVVYRFVYNTSTTGLSHTTQTFNSDLGGSPVASFTTVKNAAVDTNRDVYLCGTVESSGVASACVDRFQSGGTITYATGTTLTPAEVGLSGNDNVYLLEYASTGSPACNIYQFDNTLSLLSSGSPTNAPPFVYPDLAVTSVGASDYAFWSEYIAPPMTITAYVRSEMAAF